MEEVPAADVDCPSNKCFYLPHHCVFKEDSTTTKLRVVFDGSAKTTKGVSINDALMVGPVVQDYFFLHHQSVSLLPDSSLWRHGKNVSPNRTSARGPRLPQTSLARHSFSNTAPTSNSRHLWSVLFCSRGDQMSH